MCAFDTTEADVDDFVAAVKEEMAQRLAEGVRAVHGVEILHPVQANAVFARLPHDVTLRLQKRYRFYFWDESAGDVRWMCAFDTTEDDVDGFVAALKEEMAQQ